MSEATKERKELIPSAGSGQFAEDARKLVEPQIDLIRDVMIKATSGMLAGVHEKTTSLREVTAWHRVISDECRENNGDVGLLVPMSLEMQGKLHEALEGYKKGQGVKIHLKVTVELPSQNSD